MDFSDVTPNLLVADIEKSRAFYQDVLGFSVVTTVPDAAPFVFVWMQRGRVSVFLNEIEAAREDLAVWRGRQPAGTASLFIAVEAPTTADGVDALFAQVSGRAPVVMPLKDQFYGMREFGIEDPDGYVIFFAQRIA